MKTNFKFWVSGFFVGCVISGVSLSGPRPQPQEGHDLLKFLLETKLKSKSFELSSASGSKAMARETNFG